MKAHRSDSYKNILKYTSLFGGVQGLNLLFGLVRNKIVSVLLGPAGMGLASLMNTAVNFIFQGTNFGISVSGTRQVSEIYEKDDHKQTEHFIRVVRSWSLLSSLFGLFGCMLVSTLLDKFTFSWGDHRLHFLLLSPAVAMMAITGGEIAILKGIRKLRTLAVIQLWNGIIALAVSPVIYYYFGQSGIVPVIVILAFSSMLLTIGYSYRLYPPRISLSKTTISEGWGMIRLGTAFVLGGIMTACMEMVIRGFLNVHGDLDTVGLYNAGFMMTVTYSSIVFSALESEYFPRLSSTIGQIQTTNVHVNRQIEMTLLIITPLLTLLIAFQPLLIPLLFTTEFLPVVSMSQIVLLSIILRAVYLPIAYLTLAKGDSLPFLLLEAFYNVLVMVLIMVGFKLWGLFGTGVALAIGNVSDLLVIIVFAKHRYQYKSTTTVRLFLAIFFTIGLMSYLLTFVSAPYLYWPLQILLIFLCTGLSWYFLRQRVSMKELFRLKK